MRIWDILALLAIVVLAVVGKAWPDGGSGETMNPRRPDPRQMMPAPPSVPDPGKPGGETLPPGSDRDPVINIQAKARTSSSRGTAFSVNGGGIWVTARHVTSGCDRVVLGRDRRFVRVSRVHQEPSADISILWTRGGRPPLPVIQPSLRAGQDGFSFGYPKGEPGDVHGRIIGRRQIRHWGRHDTIEPAIAWTQVRRIPDRGTDLSGISGGPWTDGAGRVIGVHVAGAPRRGRSYSTAPTALIAAIRKADVRPADAAGARGPVRPTVENFAEIGDRLRRDLSVAQVLCLVGERWRGGKS